MLSKVISEILRIDINFERATELRLRVGAPLIIVYRDFFKKQNKIISNIEINKIISYVTDNSFYAFENDFANGFINFEGYKIAISGEGIFKKKKLISFKNITSLAIRIPHEIQNISKFIFDRIGNSGSVLIIGKTASGKTTILRDIAKQLPLGNNIVIDERGELETYVGSLGISSDIIKKVPAKVAIELAMVGFNPSVILVDELLEKSVIKALYRAKMAGSRIFATFHGETIENYKLSKLYAKNLFEYYALITEKNKLILKASEE